MARAEDRTIWACLYCGAECETPASKWFPGTHPMCSVFYREPGAQWRPVDRMPECTDTTRVPIPVRPRILAHLGLKRTALGALLGVPAQTSWTWRRRLLKHQQERQDV